MVLNVKKKKKQRSIFTSALGYLDLLGLFCPINTLIQC